MLRILLVLVFAIVLLGCQKPPRPTETRKAITLSELAIETQKLPRKYMMSDKRGGFLLGSVNETSHSMTWSVDGRDLLMGYQVSIDDVPLRPILSTTILPHLVQNTYEGEVNETVTPLEFTDSAGAHAFLVRIQTKQTGTITLNVKPAAGFSQARVGEVSVLTLTQSRGKAMIAVYAGEGGKPSTGGIAVPAGQEASFLFVFSPQGNQSVRELYSRLAQLQEARATRMERLLNAAYLRTSDEKLDKAIHWVKLSLDALVIEARDTFAVAGLPWDGSLDLRDNARSLSGMGLATGEHHGASGIIRTLSRWQDTVASRSTFGRIADKVSNGIPTYDGADVTPWFIREMFGHVTWTNDTTLVKEMYSLIKRSMEGTLEYHTDSLNLLVHGDKETWMKGSPRGNRAAEIQLLWYYQQLISSFVATHVHDYEPAQRWTNLATQTVKSFVKTFIDTARHLVYDHLTRDGIGVYEPRPNAMYCLEIVGSEQVEQAVVRETFNTLAYPHGVGTLAGSDKRFQSSMENGSGLFDGPVWTSLTGQLTYALTRFDRQDLSYQITRSLIDQVLDGEMAGTLPSILPVNPHAGQSRSGRAGENASLLGMAELIRSVYQDYIGVSVDVPSNVIALHPKLPDSLQKVDCTVQFGVHPIHISYVTEGQTSRVTLHASGIDREIRIRFLWMMENRNAWKGTATLHPQKQLRLVLTEDDLFAFDGDDEAELQYKQKLTGFSQRKDFEGLEFAKVPAR